MENTWYNNYYNKAYEKYNKSQLIGFIIKLQHMYNNRTNEAEVLRAFLLHSQEETNKSKK